MKILLYENMYSPIDGREEAELSWEELSDILMHPIESEEKGFVPQIFPGSMIPNTCTKKSDDVESIDLLCLDFDDITEEEYFRVCEILRSKRWACVLASSFSHGQKVSVPEVADRRYRIRLYAPLERPVLRGEWSYFWSCIYCVFDGLPDKTCARAGSHYLLPSHPASGKPHHIQILLEGEYLNPDSLTDSVSPGVLIQSEVQRNLGTRPISRAAIDEALQKPGRKENSKRAVTALKACVLGDPYAPEGARDETLLNMAQFLARCFPTGRPNDLAEPFKAGIEIEESHGGPSFDNFKDKIFRSQGDWLQKTARKTLEYSKKQAVGARLKQRGEHYTEASLEPFLKRTNGVVKYSDLRQQLIIIRANSYYVFDGAGYIPCHKNEVMQAVYENLEFKADDLGFSLYYDQDGEGVPKQKTVEHLCRDHGRQATKAIYTYSGHSHFEARRSIMYQSGVQSPTEIVPEQVPEVDRWIKEVCKDSNTVDSFNVWLSQVPNTNQALAALAMLGPKHCGKTGLVKGLAKIWGAPAPTNMETLFSSHNDDLLNCPMVLADEAPPLVNGRFPSELIRSYISSKVHKVNPKNLPMCNLEGYIRCVFTMNNIDKLRFGSSAHSKEDFEAVADRFFFVECHQRARESFIGDLFIDEGAIASHVLWLNQQLTRESDRFGVHANSYKYIIAGDAPVRSLFGWILEYLDGVASIAGENTNLKQRPVFVNKRRLYVNTNSLLDRWDDYKTQDLRHKPTHKMLSDAVVAISTGESIRPRTSFGRNRYWEINTDYLTHYLVQNKIAEPDQIDMLLNISHEVDFKEAELALTEEDRNRRMFSIKRYLYDTRGIGKAEEIEELKTESEESSAEAEA